MKKLFYLCLIGALTICTLVNMASVKPQILTVANAEVETTPELTITPALIIEIVEKEYIPDEADIEILAKVLWGEARGINSTMEKAAVVWCVLNRVDCSNWPDTVSDVVKQLNQFTGYLKKNPATDELKEIAKDVLVRWMREKDGYTDVGRVLPAEYTYFNGNGKHNLFRSEYRSSKFWNWDISNPYEN